MSHEMHTGASPFPTTHTGATSPEGYAQPVNGMDTGIPGAPPPIPPIAPPTGEPEQQPRTKLEWALWAIRETPFYVFPLRPNDKRPLYKGAMYDGSRDPARINAWWAAQPDANIGYAYFLSHHGIIDLDIKNNGKGLETWRELCLEHGEAPTRTIRTTSGGLHLIYEDRDGYVPTKSAVWPGIDTRGVGGLGVGPGSVIDEKPYTFIDPNVPIAPLPDWIKAHFGKTVAEKKADARKAAPLADDEWDRPLSIEYAIDAIRMDLAEHGEPVMNQNKGSDGRCIVVCNRLLDFALTDGTILDLLKEQWQPNFDRDWYAEKLANAHKYRQNSEGCDRPIGMAERYERYRLYGGDDAFAAALDGIITGLAAKRREKYPFRSPEEDANQPPLDYWDEAADGARCLPRIPGGCSIVAYGQMSSHKTGVAMKLALDAVFEKGARVLYLALEGAYGIKRARLPAAVKARGKTLPDLKGRWFTFAHAPGLMVPNEIDELIDACRQQSFSPDIVVIDTLTRAAKSFDISAPQTGVGLIAGMEQIACAFDAAVIAVTHPGKDASKGSIGSSLVESLAYAVWKVTADKIAEGEWNVTLTVEKMKDGPADFHLGFTAKATDGGPPVVSGGEKVDRAATAKPGRKTENNIWATLAALVNEQLRCLPPGVPWITTRDLAQRICQNQRPDETIDDYTARIKRQTDQLSYASKFPGRPLYDYVIRAEEGQPVGFGQNGHRWRLPTLH